jgi:mannitol/fructose-specific phosphotransferase system IIA component (Ntr-type)
MKTSGTESLRFSKFLKSGGCWVLEGPAGGGSRDKWEAIAKILDLLVSSGRVDPARRDAIHRALVDREKSMSTGLECGIALPHAAVEGLEELVAGLAVFRQGVPFQSIDGSPARIVVLLLIPKERRMAYLPVLADAARLLSREGVREKLLSTGREGAAPAVETGSGGSKEILDIILAAEAAGDPAKG